MIEDPIDFVEKCMLMIQASMELSQAEAAIIEQSIQIRLTQAVELAARDYPPH